MRKRVPPEGHSSARHGLAHGVTLAFADKLHSTLPQITGLQSARESDSLIHG
jgi:hypothetical protein